MSGLAGGTGAQQQSQALRELLGVDVCLPDECSWYHKGCSDPESLPRDSRKTCAVTLGLAQPQKEDHCLQPCVSLGTWCLRPSRHLSHSSVASDLCQLNHGVCVCRRSYSGHTAMENSEVGTGRKVCTHGTMIVCAQLSHPL